MNWTAILYSSGNIYIYLQKKDCLYFTDKNLQIQMILNAKIYVYQMIIKCKIFFLEQLKLIKVDNCSLLFCVPNVNKMV